MALPGWKDLTIKVLAEFTGPVAEMLIDDALKNIGINEADMTAGMYVRFLEKLYRELPAEIDRNKACQAVKLEVLSKYGF